MVASLPRDLGTTRLGLLLNRNINTKAKKQKDTIPDPAFPRLQLLLVESDRGLQHEHVPVSLSPGLELNERQEILVSQAAGK